MSDRESSFSGSAIVGSIVATLRQCGAQTSGEKYSINETDVASACVYHTLL